MGGHGARGGEVAPPRGCSPRGPVHNLNNGGQERGERDNGQRAGAERRARCARRRRPTGRRGRCRVGRRRAHTWAGAPCWPNFCMEGGRSGRKFFGSQGRFRRTTPRAHAPASLPCMSRRAARFELVHQRPVAPLPKPRQPRPDSRPQLHRLTGRGAKVSGRRCAQAAPRRSRASRAAGKPAVDVAARSSALPP